MTILNIDWSTWAALLTVLGIVLAILRQLAKIYFPSRAEFEELTELANTISITTHDNNRQVRALYKERKEFREEVLDRIDSLSQRIDEWISK